MILPFLLGMWVIVDVPDVENDTFGTKLHWMVKDIVASPVKTIIKEGNGRVVVDYLAPHPFRGMKYHRYPIFVFEQPGKEWYLRQRAQRQEAQQAEAQQLLHQQTQSPPTAATEGIKLSPLLTLPPQFPTLRPYSTKSHPSPSHDVIDRDNFNIRKWANSNGMKPVGAHLVRCEWDSNVPQILESLGIKERAFKKIKSEETSMFDFERPRTVRKQD